ncbi:MAG TPA: ATP-dependent DNA helicase, partial [Acidimicrobiales bacterium]
MSRAAREAVAALEHVVATLPGGGEPRSGQSDMAAAVADAIESGRHLVVQAGTGTGKSLAYLVPAILSGHTVVVATTTKALQDQLAGKDLPQVAEALDSELGVPVQWAVLKGRGNYLCLQRLREVTDDGGALDLGDVLSPAVRREIADLATWAATTATGDAADLAWAPSAQAWEAVTVSSEQCPGITRCPIGEACFAEQARRRAQAAQIVVVNTHLYGTHIASGGVVLPDHKVVVIDEAHELEDTITATAGVSLGAGRLGALARVVRSVLAEPGLVDGLHSAGTALSEALLPHHGAAVPWPLPVPVADALNLARARIDAVLAALRAIDTELSDASQRKARAQKAAGSVVGDIDVAVAAPEGFVAWVEGTQHSPRLELAPVDVGPVLTSGVWDKRVAVLTSATVPLGLPERVGLAEDCFDLLDVGSPFDYEEHALLYCAAHLPDPRSAGHALAVIDELEVLIAAAGGRTLALFTSWRAMEAAVASLRPRLPYLVLAQSDLPKPALIQAFRDDEESCLFATAGLFQGIDVPGDALRCVIITRLPFRVPTEPIEQARVEAIEQRGGNPFNEHTVPQAVIKLKQGFG